LIMDTHTTVMVTTLTEWGTVVMEWAMEDLVMEAHIMVTTIHITDMVMDTLMEITVTDMEDMVTVEILTVGQTAVELSDQLTQLEKQEEQFLAIPIRMDVHKIHQKLELQLLTLQ